LDKVKEKTPTSESEPFIVEKTPEDSEDQFKLPPSRLKEKRSPEKESVSLPTRYGVKDYNTKNKNLKNVSPPTEQSQSRRESFVPSSKGSLPKSVRKKIPVNQKVPIKSIRPSSQQKQIPTRKGISKKKVSRSINKAPPRKVKTKKPEGKTLPPPSVNQTRKKEKKIILSKSPPKSIIEKKSDKKKSAPPTIIKSKIPKSIIKKKTPE
jgi:hypothetical protein